MADRATEIAATFAVAKERIAQGGPLAQIERLDLDDEAVSFVISGLEDEFTAFLADPYPRGETTVYGPDDFEFSCAGTIAEILQATLPKVRGHVPSQNQSLKYTISGCSTGGYHDDDDGLLSPTFMVREPPMGPQLRQDVDRARELFGADAVSTAYVVDHWRVRLKIALVDVQGCALLDSTTASAWGLDPDLPITVEVLCPHQGYLKTGSPAGTVTAIWQDDFPGFLIEKQLITILSVFCNVTASVEVPDCCPSEMRHENQEELIAQLEIKKASKMSEASSDPNAGFLCHLIRYTQLRVPTLHEYCSICDQPFGFPMLLRTVCSRNLCAYQFCQFGDKITTAEGLNSQAETSDLLVSLMMRAVVSRRRDLIVDPYPSVYCGPGGSKRVFHPQEKDFVKLESKLKELFEFRQKMASQTGAAWTALLPGMNEEAAGLLKWIVSSNRSYLAPLMEDQRILPFDTPFQYLLISAPPEKEREFQKLKSEHGSTFAFHGSGPENWHSILRNGLKNASGTKLQTSGAAYGAGIYLARDSNTSMAYAMRRESVGNDLPQQPCGLARQTTGNRLLENVQQMVLLAVCEVINHPSLKKHGSIWVAPREETVCTRFLLAFTGSHQRLNVIVDEALEVEIHDRMRKLNVGGRTQEDSKVQSSADNSRNSKDEGGWKRKAKAKQTTTL